MVDELAKDGQDFYLKQNINVNPVSFLKNNDKKDWIVAVGQLWIAALDTKS